MSTNPFGQVPVLPVAIPLGVALFVLLLVRLSRREDFTLPRTITAAVVATYAAGIFANTVFPIYLSPAESDAAWSPAIALIPFYDYEVEDALTNLAVFLPLGFLIPLFIQRASWRSVTLIAASISLGIELAQLAAQAYFAGGHIADVNDLIWNAAGGMIGYGIYLSTARVPRLAAFMNRFRWRDDSRSQAVPEHG